MKTEEKREKIKALFLETAKELAKKKGLKPMPDRCEDGANVSEYFSPDYKPYHIRVRQENTGGLILDVEILTYLYFSIYITEDLEIGHTSSFSRRSFEALIDLVAKIDKINNEQ